MSNEWRTTDEAVSETEDDMADSCINHSDSLHLLQVIAQQMGRGNLAIKLIATRSLQLNRHVIPIWECAKRKERPGGPSHFAELNSRQTVDVHITWVAISRNKGCWMELLCYRRILNLQPISVAYNSRRKWVLRCSNKDY